MTTRLLISLVVALVGGASFASPAQACGGFFCNNSSPVNQAAERIIFSHNADGTTTAIIQIQYSGPSESFAWMLPVVGSPDISVSSNVAMQRLQAATNPNYQLTTEVEGECDQDDFFPGSFGPDAGFAANDSGAAADAGNSPPPVSVVNQGSVGPYDFVVISVDTSAPDVGLVATEWLQENDYDVSELGRDRLVPYLESGMNLLAFRLTKGRNAGEIRPVVLSFGAGLPSIPLRPTAAAATPDMGIMVFVLGESRAIPSNYFDLELNEARINWFNANTNYNDVVTQAANEAGGQGFVTEFAGDAEPMEEAIYPSRVDGRFEQILEMERDFDVLREIAFEFRGWDGLLEVFLAELTKPAEASDEEWARDPLNTLANYDMTIWETGLVAGFDRAAFRARMDAEVLAPVRDTAVLFEAGRTMTRFYTTMSPEEMTMDPIFDFNASLPDYDNQHRARRIIECAPGLQQFEAPWRVVLDSGTIVRGEQRNWPLANSEMLPAMLTSRRVGTSGEGEVIVNNAAVVAAAVNQNNAEYPRRYPRGLIAGGGCSVSPMDGAPGAAFGTLLVLGLALMRRRRR